MANALSKLFGDIASAIKYKSGDNTNMKPAEFPNRIMNIVGQTPGVHLVTFMSEDGQTELFVRPVADGDDCADPVKRNYISKPTKEPNDSSTFEHNGWATSAGGSASASALSAVTADKIVYAAFKADVRYYNIRFWDGENLLQTIYAAYGSKPIANTPEKEDYYFESWTPEIVAVTGDADYYAKWTETLTFASASWEKIAEISEAGEAEQYFSIGEAKPVSITTANGTELTAEFVIIGFNHDDLSDGSGKAGITLASKNALHIKEITGVTQTFSTWFAEGSARRNSCQNNIGFSDSLKSVIKPVNKLTIDQKTSTLHTTVDAVWIPSLTEIHGAWSTITANKEGSKYEYYNTFNNKLFYTQGLSGISQYNNGRAALRDIYYNSYAGSLANMYIMNGNVAYESINKLVEHGVICFCI